MEFPTLGGQGFDRRANDFALRVERLQGAKQRAGIYKHALNPVGVDAITAHSLVGEYVRVGIMAVDPDIELGGPFSWVRFLQMSNRGWLGMLLSDLRQPAFNRQSVGVGLSFQCRRLFVRELNGQVHTFSLLSINLPARDCLFQISSGIVPAVVIIAE
jgi:hypothetical protein